MILNLTHCYVLCQVNSPTTLLNVSNVIQFNSIGFLLLLLLQHALGCFNYSFLSYCFLCISVNYYYYCVRDFWRRHRRKIFLSVGVVGGGYCLYKLYGAHRQRLDALEMELDVQRQSDELIKAQLSQY